MAEETKIAQQRFLDQTGVAYLWAQMSNKMDEVIPKEGKSAYQVALDNGFEGTEAEWLASLQGEPGVSGVYVGSETPTEDYNVWINPNGEATEIKGEGLTQEQITALDALFKKCKYISDATAEYEAFKTAFGIESGELEPEPEQPSAEIIYNPTEESLTINNINYSVIDENMTLDAEYTTSNENITIKEQ